jgi:hypothetical protein
MALNRAKQLGALLFRHPAILLALLPFGYLLWIQFKYAVDVPYQDEWDLVPLLEKMYRGDLSLADIWRPHNEHRLLFPQLIMIGLARLTRWNTFWELAASTLLSIGTFALLLAQAKMCGRQLALPGLQWAAPLFSVIVFSVNQFENWLWGWQVQIVLNVFAVVAGIVLLANGQLSWARFAGAALCGFIASYSFSNGVLFWPIGLLLIVMAAGSRKTLAPIAAWLCLSALAIGLFLSHYEREGQRYPLDAIFHRPLDYLAYVLKYLGGFCAQYPGATAYMDGNFAFVWGLGSLLALSWTVWRLRREGIASFRMLLPWLSLGLYSLASAFLTGIGRVAAGSDQAPASRYCTITAPWWASFSILLLILLKRSGNARTTSAARWLLQTTTVLVVLGSVLATDGAARMSRLQHYGRDRLLHYAVTGDEDPRRFVALDARNPANVVERYPVLRAHRLSLFRQGEAPQNHQ